MKFRLKLFTYAFQETPHMCSEIPLKSIKNVSNAIVLHFPLLFLAQTLLNVGAQVKSFFFILACPTLILHEGIPNLHEFTINPDQHKLLIFDDMSLEVESSKEIHDLCVVTSRKAQISCIFINQNLYQNSRFGLSIRRNMSYFTLFSTFGDNNNVKNLGRTFFSDNTLQKSFKMLAKNNKESYKNYLFLDCHHKSIFPHSMRLRSNIFDSDYPFFFVYDL